MISVGLLGSYTPSSINFFIDADDSCPILGSYISSIITVFDSSSSNSLIISVGRLGSGNSGFAPGNSRLYKRTLIGGIYVAMISPEAYSSLMNPYGYGSSSIG